MKTNTSVVNRVKIILETMLCPFWSIQDMGESYKGFLYVCLMIKVINPFLLVSNVIRVYPECQTILPLLAIDLLDLILFCSDETLEKQNILCE